MLCGDYNPNYAAVETAMTIFPVRFASDRSTVRGGSLVQSNGGFDECSKLSERQAALRFQLAAFDSARR